jgi:uncharacterized protein (DUF1778 family)
LRSALAARGAVNRWSFAHEVQRYGEAPATDQNQGAPFRRNDNVIAAWYSLPVDAKTEFQMTSASKRQPRPRETLNIRIRAEDRGLIDRAASARGTNRTDFILDAARRAAEEALLDRALISVSPKAYAEFLARLDAPAKPNQRLRRTMRTALPWKAG